MFCDAKKLQNFWKNNRKLSINLNLAPSNFCIIFIHAEIYFTVSGASNVLSTCVLFIQSPRFQSRYAEFICRGREGGAVLKKARPFPSEIRERKSQHHAPRRRASWVVPLHSKFWFCSVIILSPAWFLTAERPPSVLNDWNKIIFLLTLFLL